MQSRLPQIRESGEHDNHVFDKSVFVREAGRGEGGDGVRTLRERAIRVPHPPVTHVRIYDQLHPQTQALAGKVYDE